MKHKSLIFALLIVLLLLGGAWFYAGWYLPADASPNATTIYVDGLIGVSQCDDYNPGTRSCGSGSETAYLEIVTAAENVAPDYVVLIQPGTYAGGVVVDIGGTASEPIVFQANSSGVIIDGSGGDRDAFFITEADYVIVDGLTIQQADRAAVRISLSDHVTVRNSTLANNGTWGVFTDFSDYTMVENCESYGSVDEHGIYISNSSDSPTIRGNILHHNNANGLHMNGDISMGGDGIISYALVENNIIYENGAAGGSGINMDGVTDSLVRNNLLYNNHASGISLYQIDGGSGSQNNRVLNNTIIMPADGRWGINIPNAVDTNNKLFNNIIYSSHSYRGSILIATPTLTGFESDYNIVVDRFAADGEGDTILTLAQWQALGYDQHSFFATPAELFVDPGNGDYHLTTNSPAVDQGTALTDVPTDLDGAPRPAGLGYDIGAYEWQPAPILSGTAGDQTVILDWDLNTTLPATTTWTITYDGPSGTEPSPIENIPVDMRSYALAGLTNYVWYNLTLSTDPPMLTETISLMPTDIRIHLPLVTRE